MNPQTVQATFGCLLHDVGKAVYRAGISDGRHGEAGYRFVRDIDGYGQAKAVLDCIRYHHAAQLRQAKDCDPLAAIAYIADNIAAAADRRQTGDETRFDRYLPLSPVFTHLNGEHPGHTLPPHALDGCLRLPLDGSFRLSAGDYEQILLTLRRELSALPPQEEWLNSLLSVWESCMGTVPSSTNTGESPDISLYDHSKVTAAVGACISEYLLDRGETDYFTALVQQEQSFRLQQAFLLYSADFSGIQKFICSVSTRNALKSLRSRSFFLELCMEHYIDELLTLGVGAGAGLGQAESADLAAGAQVRQILHLLLLGAVLKNGGGAQGGMSRDDNGSGAADLGQLFHAHGIGQDVAAGAAVLLGEINTHHAQLCHLLDGFHGETLFFVDLSGQRLYFVLCEFAVHLANEQLFLRQMEIHTFFSFF